MTAAGDGEADEERKDDQTGDDPGGEREMARRGWDGGEELSGGGTRRVGGFAHIARFYNLGLSADGRWMCGGAASRILQVEERRAMSDGRASEKEKMLRGELYHAEGPELVADRQRADRLLRAYNATGADERERRLEMLRELLGEAGEGAVVQPLFRCDYGYNVFLRPGVFLNYNCVLLDVMPIRIGEGTQIGPAVQIYAADHPRDGETRRLGLECGKPVVVGRNVWIGGGAILLPGIHVGDDAVIGAGSVVTRDVGVGETVAGNPARVLRGRAGVVERVV